ncbi:unnamed protein product [Linum tenue]|uniref:Uncharacterized protein n=1 Tax=Linum tenue TaxID=586396 RepID=A0AAV0NUI3_9ROSI|nr:unnamed protein product [Linum tenue]
MATPPLQGHEPHVPAPNSHAGLPQLHLPPLLLRPRVLLPTPPMDGTHPPLHSLALTPSPKSPPRSARICPTSRSITFQCSSSSSASPSCPIISPSWCSSSSSPPGSSSTSPAPNSISFSTWISLSIKIGERTEEKENDSSTN